MGALLGKRHHHHRYECVRDTAILVHSEVGPQRRSCEEISLNINTSLPSLQALKFGRDVIQTLESPSECTTLSTMSTLTAGPLDQKHKYHMFFAYHPSNKEWLHELVQRLEAEPWAYKCCYADRDFDSRCTSTQNVLCSIMLSNRIVVVLTPRFIKDQWVEYEESLAHLASMTLRKQRVVPIILEETNIPDSLRMLRAVDARREDFWDVFLQNVCLDGLTFSDSMHTIRSLSSQSSVSGFVNGQVLTSLTATVNGFIKSQLLFDYEEVPDPLIKDDINLSRQEFADLVKIVGHEDAGQRLSWLFTALPTILLAILFTLWCVAFILVILLFPDDAPSTLPVRLCVFSLPAIFIVLGCILRWRKLKTHKEQYSVSMFSRSVAVNQLLYERSKPVIITTARTNEDTFHIYFLYYNMADCVERVKIFLTHCTDEDIIKLAKLIEVYTLHTGYLEGKPLAIRLAVMMSAAFAIQTVFKRLPHAIEQRHTRRRQCLCQFTEEFLAAYLPCIRTGADLANVKFLFLKYLNCHIQPEPVILHALGINITEVS